MVGQVVDPHVLSPPRPVALPVAPLPALDVERQLGAGGVIRRSRGPLRDLQGHLQPAVHRVHQVVVPHPFSPGSAGHSHEDLRPVGSPVEHQVVVAPSGSHGTHIGIEGELPRCAAGGGDDVHLPGPRVLTGEGDPTAVGAEPREDLQALVGGEAPGLPAGDGGGVEVPSEGEHHRVPVDVGEPEKAGLLLCPGRTGPGQESDRHKKGHGRWKGSGAHRAPLLEKVTTSGLLRPRPSGRSPATASFLSGSSIAPQRQQHRSAAATASLRSGTSIVPQRQQHRSAAAAHELGFHFRDNLAKGVPGVEGVDPPCLFTAQTVEAELRERQPEKKTPLEQASSRSGGDGNSAILPSTPTATHLPVIIDGK